MIAGLLAVGGLVLPGVGAAQPVAPEPRDRLTTAAFAWSVPARYQDSWNAWQPGTATYAPEVVNPKGWSINLDACASRSLGKIERYTFVITGITTPDYRLAVDGPACQARVHGVLPVLGLYRVEVTAHTASGASAPLTRIVRLRDHLIVSIGDSLQSGEGVPEAEGRYEISGPVDALTIIKALPDLPPMTTLQAAVWKDRRCHRSSRGGPALAAQAIEDGSPHTSVTFLSFACSGAELPHLYEKPYPGCLNCGAGADGANGLLPPQLDAVKTALAGRDPGTAERQIDALMVSAGINDLEFAAIIRACASNRNTRPGHTDCVDGFAASKLAKKPEFAARYDRLAAAVRALKVREIYLNCYPVQAFKGGGCGFLGIEGVGINSSEGESMNTLGIFLNHVMENAADRYRAEGWNLVGDLSAPFEPHAYCADKPWFNHLEDSLATQGDERGTAHPNRDGHRAFARILRRAIVPDQPQTPFRVAFLTINKVKLPATSHTGETGRVDLELVRYPSDLIDRPRRFSVPRNGQWTPVPRHLRRFRIELFRAPASPRDATEVRLTLNRELTIHHGFDERYGPGSHERDHRQHHIAVQYHIQVVNPRDAGQPPVDPTAQQ